MLWTIIREKLNNGIHLTYITNLKSKQLENQPPGIKAEIRYIHPQHYLNHNNLARKNNEKISK
jgi:hypothetical protein